MPDKRSLADTMVMSSSTHDRLSGRPFYLVQSGIALWEAPEPVAQWNIKTVTACAETEHLLADMAIRLLEASTDGIQWLRLHATAFEPEMGVMQKRRTEKALSSPVPGFSEGILCASKKALVSIARLEVPSAINVEYLTSYRDTVLVGINCSTIEPKELCRAISTKQIAADGVIDANVFRTLWEALGDLLVARFLDMETHAVVQLLGHGPAIRTFPVMLEELDVERLLDSRSVPSRIASWGRCC